MFDRDYTGAGRPICESVEHYMKKVVAGSSSGTAFVTVVATDRDILTDVHSTPNN